MTLDEWIEKIKDNSVVRIGGAFYEVDPVIRCIQELQKSIIMHSTDIAPMSACEVMLFAILKAAIEEEK